MKISLRKIDAVAIKSELLAVLVFAKEAPSAEHAALDRELLGVLTEATREERFLAQEGELLVVNTLKRLRTKRVALLGAGEQHALDEERALALGARLARLAAKVGARSVEVVLPAKLQTPAMLALLARAAMQGEYRFERYRAKKTKLKECRLALRVAEVTTAHRVALRRAEVVAKAVALARELVDEPANALYPAGFAARAAKLAKARGLFAKVYEGQALSRLSMRLLLAVGGGSAHAPALVHLTYRAKKKAKGTRPLVLVGKGITFDSGGLCIKPAASMATMKSDMAGAAAVLAAMQAISELGARRDVHAVIALAENMPSGTALRPGDVVTSAGGKTVEITNTDAEGRLILADALTFACGLSPAAIIDVATLTGACVVALGDHTAGLFANDDELAQKVQKSARAAGESLWRLPLLRALEAELASDVADLRGSGAREGGAITAALFLREFVGKTPWAHLDIAGPALAKRHGTAKGATGIMTATLVDLAVA